MSHIFHLAIVAIAIAVAMLLCPQPPIDNVLEEIALPLATAYVKGHNHNHDPQLPLQGIRILITGPTSGIGRAMSTVLNDMGAEVIGIGRSESKLQGMMMNNINNNNNSNGILKGYHVADMSDLRSVATAANDILEKYERIDMMIANAGVHYHWTTLGSPATQQGLDLVFGVNYMSHFLLIEKLVPLLEQSNFAKLMYTNSFYHYAVDGSHMNTAADDDDDDNDTSSSLPPAWIYANTTCPRPFFRDQYMYGSSKFAMMLHAESLRARYNNNINNNTDDDDHRASKKRLNIVSVDPGWTATNLNGESGSILYLPLQWIGFPVNGWGLSSSLHALFSLDNDNDNNDDNNDDDKDGSKIYFSNAQNYDILPRLFNSPTWRNGPHVVKETLRLRDWIGVIQGFILGFMQRFYYKSFAMPPAVETTDVQLQKNVYAWSRQVVAEFLE